MVRGARQIKVSFCTFREDGGGERSIRFAELDFGVDDIFHLRISRVSEDAAIPQGAGPPLEASLEPAHHLGERSEEHTSELQSRGQLVCRLLLEKKKIVAASWILVSLPYALIQNARPPA